MTSSFYLQEISIFIATWVLEKVHKYYGLVVQRTSNGNNTILWLFLFKRIQNVLWGRTVLVDKLITQPNRDKTWCCDLTVLPTAQVKLRGRKKEFQQSDRGWNLACGDISHLIISLRRRLTWLIQYAAVSVRGAAASSSSYSILE